MATYDIFVRGLYVGRERLTLDKAKKMDNDIDIKLKKVD